MPGRRSACCGRSRTRSCRSSSSPWCSRTCSRSGCGCRRTLPFPIVLAWGLFPWIGLPGRARPGDHVDRRRRHPDQADVVPAGDPDRADGVRGGPASRRSRSASWRWRCRWLGVAVGPGLLLCLLPFAVQVVSDDRGRLDSWGVARLFPRYGPGGRCRPSGMVLSDAHRLHARNCAGDPSAPAADQSPVRNYRDISGVCAGWSGPVGSLRVEHGSRRRRRRWRAGGCSPGRADEIADLV